MNVSGHEWPPPEDIDQQEVVGSGVRGWGVVGGEAQHKTHGPLAGRGVGSRHSTAAHDSGTGLQVSRGGHHI